MDPDPSRFIGVPGAPRPGVWDAATTELGPLNLPAGGVFPGHERPTGVSEPRRSQIAIAMVVAFFLLITAVVWLTRGSAPARPTGTGIPTAAGTSAAAPVVPPPTPTATPSVSPTASAPPSRTATPTATRRPTATPTTRPPSTTGAPTGPAAAPLTVGGRRSLRLADTTSTYVVRASGIAALASVTTSSSSAQRASATFTVVSGLADSSCYSFRADNGAYMRHRNRQLFVEVDNGSNPGLYRQDATFCPQSGTSPGSYTFWARTDGYRDFAIHRDGGELWIDRTASVFVVTKAWG